MLPERRVRARSRATAAEVAFERAGLVDGAGRARRTARRRATTIERPTGARGRTRARGRRRGATAMAEAHDGAQVELAAPRGRQRCRAVRRRRRRCRREDSPRQEPATTRPQREPAGRHRVDGRADSARRTDGEHAAQRQDQREAHAATPRATRAPSRPARGRAGDRGAARREQLPRRVRATRPPREAARIGERRERRGPRAQRGRAARAAVAMCSWGDRGRPGSRKSACAAATSPDRERPGERAPRSLGQRTRRASDGPCVPAPATAWRASRAHASAPKAATLSAKASASDQSFRAREHRQGSIVSCGPRERMRGVVDPHEVLDRHVRVALRRRERSVPEHLLDGAEIRAPAEHVRRTRVT